MHKTELLAPAKNKEIAISAINSGCDALYIGAIDFGARKKAGNSLNDIKEIVEYAHKFYVRVHVTINTILKDSEIEKVKTLINKLYEIGVDAIIVQDCAIFELAIKNEIPQIAIHASTQCDNRTLEKVKFFDDLGASRVILARELTLNQIANICQNTKTEIETFIHGALCVSYSGQCYLSAYIGGRSANRGECAQACRKPYSLVDESGNIIAKDKYLLSLKDFNASDYIEKLVVSGVNSFKIEGRLKDKNYIKNVVYYYRNKLDKISKKTSSGKTFTDFQPDVKKSFNRGFTDYFLNGRNKNSQIYNFDTPKSIGEYLGKVVNISDSWFEIDTDKRLHPQDGLYIGNGGCLINKVAGKKIYPNKMDNIKLNTKIYRNFDSEFENRLNKTIIKRQIGVKIEYFNGSLYIEDEDRNSVKTVITNCETAKNPDRMKENFINQFNKTGNEDFYVESIKIKGEIPFIPISKINELRRNIFKNLMTERIKNYKRPYQKQLKYTKYPKSEINYKANIHNRTAKNFYQNCGCKVCGMSFESSLKKDKYELMRTKHCLKFAFNMCKTDKKLYLVDEKNTKFPLDFDCKNCEMIIYNK